MTPAELSRAVLSTVRRAVAAEELRVAVPDKVVVRRPPRPGCGDYATNVALQLAGPAGRTPYEVAEILARRLEKEPGIAQVEIAAAGFLNITLNAQAYGDVVRQVRAQRSGYGRGDGLAGEVLTVTGAPGAVRGRVVAEVVNRLFRAAGADPAPPGAVAELIVVQEVQEAEGTQRETGTEPEGVTGAGVPAAGSFGTGLPAAAAGTAAPGASAGPAASASCSGPAGSAASASRRYGAAAPAAAAGPAASATTASASRSGPASRAAPASRTVAAGPAVPSAPPGRAAPASPTAPVCPAVPGDHASPAASGAPAAPDTHTGPDGRLAVQESAAEFVVPPVAPAHPSSALPGHPVPYASYAPYPLFLLGNDATRWALLRHPAEDAPRLGPALLEQRESNPLFRVRYAHARTRALGRNARQLGVRVETTAEDGEGALYHHPAETELLGLIADFPRVVETAARRRAPDRVARHMERLADAFLRFQDECPPLPKGDEKPSAAHAARVRLADATGVVLAGGLHLLGISAPDHL